MLDLLLISNSTFFTNLVALLLGLIIFIFVLLGKIAPKLGFSVLFLVSFLNYFYYLQTYKTAVSLSKQPFVAKDTQVINTRPPVPETYSKPIAPIIRPNKEKVEKETPRYITKVQIEGVSNKMLFKKFEEKSGYTIAKKGDYLITFSYSGSIKKGNNNDSSRFVYSGGHLIVNVGSSQCCCSGIVPLPKNIPLGKSMKQGLKIMSEKVEAYALANIDIITPMIVECLPKY